VLAGFAAYHNSFYGAFVFDDMPAIRENPTLRTLWPLTVPLSPPANTGVGGRPLANLSFALNHALGGDDVRGYHAVNLLLHLGSALLLLGLVRRTWRGASPWAAWSVALLWCLHPLTTAAVSYVSQRTELLAGFLYLLTLYAFARGAAANRRGWLALSVAACALGMLSKEVMVTAPLLVLLYDRTFVAGEFRAAWTRRRGYYLALSATLLVLAAVLTSDLSQRSVGFGLGVSAWTYTLASAQAVLLYLKLGVWPAPLVFDYGPVYGGVTAASLGALAVVLALVIWTVRALRRPSVAGFLTAAFLLLLAPTTSVVPIAEQPIAENRAYLALAVVVSAAAILVRRRVRPPVVAGAMVALAAVGLGALTIARNHDYRTDSALWSDTAAKRPQNPRAHFNLGLILLRLDRPAEALERFQTAIRLRPGDSRAHNSLGTALLALDRAGEAVAAIRHATQLDPRHAPAWHNLGLALLRTGDAAGALDALGRALTLNSNHAATHLEVGNARFQLNQSAQALAAYEHALQLDPTLVNAHYNAGSACLELGRLEEAVAHFAAALRRRPDDPEIHNHHGAALLRAGRVGEAIAAFEQALRLRPDYADARDNLAVARGVRR
jgi:tetratricopeptide (TPR) repeat protein